MGLRTIVKEVTDIIFHPIGLNIERYFGSDLALKQLLQCSRENNIDLLLDIGANTGQFAQAMIRLGFNKPVLSFEPLSSAYVELKRNADKFSTWEVFERCAIGDFDGEIEINISKNSHSSSILPISKTHLDAAASAVFIDKEKVPVKKLDSIAEKLKGENILLKIDTQGYEDRVISGAMDTVLDKVKLIQLEMSLLPLYEGSMTFTALHQLMEKIGFKPLFYTPGYSDRTNENIQQIEGYFIKDKNK